jgi:hypothetical protein
MPTSPDTVRDKAIIARISAGLSVPCEILIGDSGEHEVRTRFASGVLLLWSPSHYSSGHAVDLLEMVTPQGYRNLGLARAALDDFLAACDRADMDAFSLVLPADRSFDSRLVAWFARVGFVLVHPDEGSGTLMRRDFKLSKPQKQ